MTPHVVKIAEKLPIYRSIIEQFTGQFIRWILANTTQVERYGDVRSVLLYAEIRAVISLKWSVIRPYYVTIRWSYTVTFWHTAVGNRIVTVHGRVTVYFNDSTARISAYNNTDRMRTRIRSVLFVLGSISKPGFLTRGFFLPEPFRMFTGTVALRYCRRA